MLVGTKCSARTLERVCNFLKIEPTPAFLPVETPWTQEPGGYSPWGHKESDTTERLSTDQIAAVPCLRIHPREMSICSSKDLYTIHDSQKWKEVSIKRWTNSSSSTQQDGRQLSNKRKDRQTIKTRVDLRVIMPGETGQAAGVHAMHFRLCKILENADK